MIARNPLRTTAHATSGDLTSLSRATQWLNSEPLTAAALAGHVVLISFWTYSCINWRRTLPHLLAWTRRYEQDGLTVIGVHTPEFDFEHDADNVRRATIDANIHFPVVLDNDYAIWRDLENQYWPALYFVDAHGNVRYRTIGETSNDQANALIHQLLTESGAEPANPDRIESAGVGVERPADWASLRSPETYLGFDRADNFSSPGGLVGGRPNRYTEPARLRTNHWSLDGDWTISNQAASSNAPEAKIAFRFDARDLHLVMGARDLDRPARFQVLLDGKPPGAAHGLDIDADGNGVVAEPRLYQLIRQPQLVRKARFEIRFDDPAVDAYVFTFG